MPAINAQPQRLVVFRSSTRKGRRWVQTPNGSFHIVADENYEAECPVHDTAEILVPLGTQVTDVGKGGLVSAESLSMSWILAHANPHLSDSTYGRLEDSLVSRAVCLTGYQTVGKRCSCVPSLSKHRRLMPSPERGNDA